MPAGPISWVIRVLLRKSVWAAILKCTPYSFFQKLQGFGSNTETFDPFGIGWGWRWERRIKFHFAIWRYPVFPIPFVMATFLWCVFLAFCKKNSGGSRWVDLDLDPRVYSTNQWTCSHTRAMFDYSDFAVTWNYEQKCLQHSFCCSGLLWLVRVFRASI